jgi:hypothetical protein
MINYPARLAPVPKNKVDDFLPAGEVITVRRVYPAEMQPDQISKWSRTFLKERIAIMGAFFSGPLRGSDTDATTIGIPATDGGMIFVVNDTKPAPTVQELKPVDQNPVSEPAKDG